MAPKIGDVVYYHTGNEATGTEVEDYVVAAIVTMTPQQWQPGYRDKDGEWVPTVGVTQPKAGCVHLKLFLPPGVEAGAPVDFTDVPQGTTRGCWSNR